jgi:hypothetical protein
MFPPGQFKGRRTELHVLHAERGQKLGLPSLPQPFLETDRDAGTFCHEMAFFSELLHPTPRR